MKPSDEDIELALNNLLEKGSMPNPDHYPNIVKTMIKHELYEIARKKEVQPE